MDTTRRLVLTAGLGLLAPSVWAIAAPGPQLAMDAEPGSDPQGWLVSEKLDGVRALWDGARLRFRSGRLIAAPAWFLAALPPAPLDGELWAGRGRFDAASAAVRREQPQDSEWRALRYEVFDQPGTAGPFAERAASPGRLAAGRRPLPGRGAAADPAGCRRPAAPPGRCVARRWGRADAAPGRRAVVARSAARVAQAEGGARRRSAGAGATSLARAGMPAAWARCGCNCPTGGCCASAPASATRSATHRRPWAAWSRTATAAGRPAACRASRAFCACRTRCSPLYSTSLA